MSHYPPQYGLRANAARVEDRKQEPSANPSEEQLILSVQKGLWFPILTNLTNLSLDKANGHQQESMDIFFEVLQQGVDIFSLEFW
jgi:hypothetical protein